MKEFRLECSAKKIPDGFMVDIGQESWHIARSANLEELWAKLDNFEDERIPYWTELWPSGIVLSAWLVENADLVRNKLCLDLGCGLGVASIAGQAAGARVLAVDYEPDSLIFCRKNCQLNQLSPAMCLAMDWRHPAFKPHCIDIIWGADIIYEKRFIAPVIGFLEQALKKDGAAFIAEPGRTIFDHFRAAIEQSPLAMELAAGRSFPSMDRDGIFIDVRIWKIRHRREEYG